MAVTNSYIEIENRKQRGQNVGHGEWMHACGKCFFLVSVEFLQETKEMQTIFSLRCMVTHEVQTKDRNIPIVEVLVCSTLGPALYENWENVYACFW